MKYSKPIIILGMHRSGTSCLAGSLQQIGVNLGKVSESNKYNKKGNRENLAILALNDSILSLNEGSWRVPPSELRWTKEQEQERDSILKELSAHGGSYWGFKDPRTLITFEFWRQGLPNGFQLIGTFRHPLDVAESLASRPPPIYVPMNEGINLWKYYNQLFLRLYEQYKFPVISFNLKHDEYLKVLSKIVVDHGLEHNQADGDFFDSSLVGKKSFRKKNILADDVSAVYQKLLDIEYSI